jgi:cyanocobalamin reductase (cyanide-eliminating) / alkylcobalamin dealkylase
MQRRDWRSVAAEIGSSLTERGLDLVHPFQVGWYNGQMRDAARCLPDLGRTTALGLLIGNTRAFWPLFRTALDAHAHLQSALDPVDLYTSDAVLSAFSVLELRWIVRWAHDLEPEPLPIQRIAWATGLAMLSPSHLSVHPVHGPWIALRAVAIVDIDGPDGGAPACVDHCTKCHKPCVEALQLALNGTHHTPDAESLERDWESWVGVRDACPIGAGARYCDEQIRYHYTKLRRLLA